MASTFFGLTISSSALFTYQAAVNTTANNIANVQTKGYTRQEALRQAAESLRVNQKYGTAGSGVDTTAIKQIRDYYYDVKYWNNNSEVGLYDTKLYYMQQLEDYLIDDDTMDGFSTILGDMFNSLDTLKTNAGDLNVRNQFISKTQSLVNYFNSISTGFSKVQDDCNQEISTQVSTINSIAQKVSLLNKQINIIELQGGYANELRDQRALLIDELSAIVPVEVQETQVANSNYPDKFTGATNYVVKINGHTLVSTETFRTLECVAREDKVNQSDNEGLYDIRWSDNKVSFNPTSGGMSGTLRGLFEMRDGNNAENFTATVSTATSSGGNTSIVLHNASITDINKMTMPGESVIVIGNKEYKYTSYSFDAATQSYTFELEDNLTASECASLGGKRASIGTSIDAMGIPYYMAQLNTFLREFCKQFNDIQLSGVDANGNDAGVLFVSKDVNGDELTFDDHAADGSMNSLNDTYFNLTASSLAIASAVVKDPNLFSCATKDAHDNGTDAYDLVEEMLKLYKDVSMYRGSGANEFLQCILSDVSVDGQKTKIFSDNYNNISNTIVQKRMSISGVDEDEEALDLLKFQNAYNLASKMVQTMTEMYDRLILQTGV